jgi:hypothetical protein
MKKEESFLGLGTIVTASFMLTASAVAYVLVSPQILRSMSPQMQPDPTFTTSSAYFLLIIAFAFSLLVFFNEQQLELIDLKNVETVDQRVLSAKLAELNPEAASAAAPASETELEQPTPEDALKAKFRVD